jgi:hypothetical protein
MPTGYTAGIIDGKTKSFGEFAKQCARAFGATVHMRDDSFDKPFEPRKPSDYHKKAIKEAKSRSVDHLSDDELVERERVKLREGIEYYEIKIQESKATESKLRSFLSQAESFVPPTEEHKEIKNFMIQQITETISWDCNTEYMEKAIIDKKNQLASMDAASIRKEILDSIAKDIAYHTEKYSEEYQRASESNQWVRQYFEAIDALAKGEEVKA